MIASSSWMVNGTTLTIRPSLGVLSPVLFALCIDGVISELKLSGHGVHIGTLFIGCVLYADDIVLLSASCHGLQQLVNIL